MTMIFFEYVEGGEGDVVILVHGFQSNKNFWIPYMKELIKNYKVIALDLPGHGNSSRPSNQCYSIQELAKTFTKFIDVKKLDNFHLIGSSLGGGIITIYASENPQKVKSLVLFNPLGIDQEHNSELQDLLLQGKNIFFPNNEKEFNEMCVFIMGKELKLNSYFKKFAVNQMIKNYPFFKKAFNEMLSKTKSIDDLLPKVTPPVLLLIGDKDRLINPITYEYFIRLMPNVKPVKFSNGNHVFVDNDLQIAKDEIVLFLKDK